jgi:hypothetical protein
MRAAPALSNTVYFPPGTDGELEALEREFDAVAAADADATAGLAAKAQADWRRGVAVSDPGAFGNSLG